KPVQNAFAESFIGRLRDELLNETLFRSLSHARAVLEAWRADYNNERPHSRLGWMSPSIYSAARQSAALRSTDRSAQRIAAIPANRASPRPRLQFRLDKIRGQRHTKPFFSALIYPIKFRQKIPRASKVFVLHFLHVVLNRIL